MILKKVIDNSFYSTNLDDYPIRYSVIDKEKGIIGESIFNGGKNYISFGGLEYSILAKKKFLKNTTLLLVLGHEKILEVEIYDTWQIWPLSVIGKIIFENIQYNVGVYRNEDITYKNRKLQYLFKISCTNQDALSEISFEVECYNILPINIQRVGFEGKIDAENINLIIPLVALNFIERSLYEYDINENSHG